MRSRKSLTRAFTSIPGAPLRGLFFRAIALEHMQMPLSAIGSIRRGGRFNPASMFEMFYVATSPDTTLYELQALSPRAAPTRLAPIVIFTVEVALQSVVDLTDDAVKRALDVSDDDLRIDWKAVVAAGRVPITHDIGAAARAANVEALMVPSARHTGATNMSIIVDRLRRGSKIEIGPSTGFAAGTSIVIYGKYSEGRPQSKSDGPG